MTDIRAGDVVVCVDAKPRAEGMSQYLGSGGLKLGHLYRVVGADRGKHTGKPVLILADIAPPPPARSYYADRFRKIDAADEQFTARIRKCRPAKTREPAL